MKKSFIILLVIVGIIIKFYLLAVLVAYKLKYKFSGLATIDNVEHISDILNFKILVSNPTIFPLKIRKFDLYITDNEGNVVYDIEPIDRVAIRGLNDTEIVVDTKTIRPIKLATDILSGKDKEYKYTVTGKINGVFPFRYTGKVYS